MHKHGHDMCRRQCGFWYDLMMVHISVETWDGARHETGEASYEVGGMNSFESGLYSLVSENLLSSKFHTCIF